MVSTKTFLTCVSAICAIALTASGCGGDDDKGGSDAGPSGGSDAGPRLDAGPTDAATTAGDAGPAVNCTGMANGTSCGAAEEHLICVMNRCVAERCGDGVVSGTEECDDGNAISRDGCEPSCRFTCTATPFCDNANPCDGLERCNTTTHRCEAGTPPTITTECLLDMGGMGVCRGGSCTAAGCGNGVVEGTEQCDDGNDVTRDGCEPTCVYSCTMASDCNDGDMCNGEETCNTTSHRCETGTALSCDDSQACSTDTCEAAVGCVHTLVDSDGDGFAMGTCTLAGTNVGGDCNDGRSDIYPGSPSESSCDAIDSNCDGSTTDGPGTTTCYRDVDGDGFGQSGLSMSACECPIGYVPERPQGYDCMDNTRTISSTVNPAQTGWYTTSYCPAAPPLLCLVSALSFDYNCDGMTTKHWTGVSTGCGGAGGRFGCFGSGWVGSEPACGASGTYRTCAFAVSGGGLIACTSSEAARTQECQ